MNISAQWRELHNCVQQQPYFEVSGVSRLAQGNLSAPMLRFKHASSYAICMGKSHKSLRKQSTKAVARTPVTVQRTTYQSQIIPGEKQLMPAPYDPVGLSGCFPLSLMHTTEIPSSSII